MQQQQQPPAATSAPAPVVTAPGVVAPSPLVYQQLASGQIQMYQLPPGYVPVLVSNTGSLQPLVSLPPQPQIPQPQPSIDSLGVPADNNSRRSSSNMQGYEYAAPMQMMIVPEQQQQQQQQPQQQMVVQAEQPQLQMPMEYTPNQPQQQQVQQQPQMIPVSESYQPSMVMQQPQMVPPTEAYNGQQQQPLPVQPTPEPYVQQQQQPVVMQPQMVPDGYAAAQPPMPVAETYVQQPQPLTEPYAPTAAEAYGQPQIPNLQATEPMVDGSSQLVQGEPTALSEEVYHQAVSEAEHLNNPEAEMLEESCGTGNAAVAEDLEAVEGEDCLEEGLDDTGKPDVSGLLPGQVATHHAVGYVVHPVSAQHVQYQVHPSHSVSSSTLYSATSMSSLSSSCDFLSHAPYYTHSLSHPEQLQNQNPQRKNSAGPVIGQPSGHASLIAASDNAALLRRGSLPHSILLMKQDFGCNLPNVSTLGSNSRRSSSGTVVPLATLREKAGDSDLSNEDLSQVSLGCPTLLFLVTIIINPLFFPDFCDDNDHAFSMIIHPYI